MGSMPRVVRSSLRKELFANPIDGLVSVLLITGLGAAVYRLLHWAFGQAQWAVIQANSTLFAVGRYPIEQQWRLWVLVALLAAATGLSWGALRGLPSGTGRLRRDGPGMIGLPRLCWWHSAVGHRRPWGWPWQSKPDGGPSRP